MKLSFLSRFPKLQLWLVNRLVTYLFVLSQFGGRNRISHNNGLVTKGKLRILDDPTFPEHDFFQAGREFPCRFRFSTVRLYDDTVLAVRGVSIKFADTPYKSPLDLEMNTGTAPLFSTASNFLDFISLTVKGSREHFLPYFEQFPMFRKAAETSVRRSPSSFLQLYFYTQTPTLFTSKAGQKFYIKYRLVPEDRGEESGIASAEDLETVYIQDPLQGETRTRNYLKDELKERVSNADAVMIMQMQLHPMREGDSNEICNPNLDWDESEFPWHDLAVVDLDSYLPYEEGHLHIFSTANYPSSLGLLKANSIDDYNSINLMRAKSMPAKRARLLAYKIFGMPDPIPDERDDPARKDLSNAEVVDAEKVA